MPPTALRWLVTLASFAAFLAAAKAHGRQLRLERELFGYFEVRFGAVNPPFVEALWHRERVAFWITTLALGACAIGYALIATRFGWPRPLVGRDGDGTGFGLLVPALLWAPIVAFVALGVASLVRLLDVKSATARAPSADWSANALSGSVSWWSLTAALLVVTGLLTWRASS